MVVALMTAVAKEQQWIEKLNSLTPDQQDEIMRIVDEMTRKVAPDQPSGARLQKHVGCISDEDAREMMEAIENAFGQINPETWK